MLHPYTGSVPPEHQGQVDGMPEGFVRARVTDSPVRYTLHGVLLGSLAIPGPRLVPVCLVRVDQPVAIGLATPCPVAGWYGPVQRVDRGMCSATAAESPITATLVIPRATDAEWPVEGIAESMNGTPPPGSDLVLLAVKLIRGPYPIRQHPRL